MSYSDILKTGRDIGALCDLAERKWLDAPSRTKKIGFTFRGKKFVTWRQGIRMLVDTDRGRPIARRYC